eukprot:344659_1
MEQTRHKQLNKIIETYGVNYGVTTRSRYKKKALVLKDHHPVFQSVPIMDIERCIQIMGMSHNRENNTFTESFTTETPQRSTGRSPLRSLDPNSPILHQQNVLKSPDLSHRQLYSNQSPRALNANVQSLRIQITKLQTANRKLITENTILQSKIDNIRKAKDQIENRLTKAVNDINLLRAQNRMYKQNIETLRQNIME